MGLVSDFNTALELWFNAHGIPNLNFVEGETFCFYHQQKNVVQWGFFFDEDTENNFSQFMHEYGCTYNTPNNFVESILHEVGHYLTMPNFTAKEIASDDKAKDKQTRRNKGKSVTIDVNYWYWELPIEFAANLWMINFINAHKDWVIDLYNLCEKHLTAIFNDDDINEQLQDWLADAADGIDEPLVIIEHAGEEE